MKLKSMVAVGAVTVACLIPLGAVSASATVNSFGVCVPSDATTTTVEHAAVGEPTIEIPNPEYIPAVPAIPAKPAVGEPTMEIDNPDHVPAKYVPAHTVWVPPVYTPAVGKPTMIVNVPNPDYKPAVPEVAEVSHTDYVAKRYVVTQEAQEATFKTQWKYVMKAGHGEIWLDSDAHKWVDSNGNAAEFGDWPIYERTQKTRQVETSPATPEQGHWEEKSFHEHPGDGWEILATAKHVTQEYVAGQPAVGSETIEQEVPNPDYVAPTYVPGYNKQVPAQYTPAVGPKKITVPNPDYVPATEEIPEVPAVGEETLVVANPGYTPAWVETVTTAAVECPVADAPKPAVKAAAKVQAEDDSTLAVTGGEVSPWLLGGGLLAMLTGAGALVARRKH